MLVFECGYLLAAAFAAGLALGLLCLAIDRCLFRQPYAFKGEPREIHTPTSYPHPAQHSWASPHSITRSYGHADRLTMPTTPDTLATLSLDSPRRPASIYTADELRLAGVPTRGQRL